MGGFCPALLLWHVRHALSTVRAAIFQVPLGYRVTVCVPASLSCHCCGHCTTLDAGSSVHPPVFHSACISSLAWFASNRAVGRPRS
ncbi:hypothetical protein BU14_0237s0010 [Porphyra umbilicalis]|uniref:Secreted protein n=1 Tax=Porphyra umbilicalis TaxID=2786 RepID=A0A1X6P3L2_PORUM|nr:hypothetical protein BU14_0237s0010 [Porphyra umbilicalis]|eukprot:OSX75417.1 hypothetical protein BU14_0237s0010 [Porphyra umbilicalis]